jgi:undecaprenyl diphosphate synthase
MAEDSKPRHIGMILDGNRRWAKQRGLPPMEGHLAGYKNLKDLAIYALKDRGIEYVSGYVFSTENWNRTKDEVGYLMKLVLRALTEYLDEFHRENIKITVLGTKDKLSKSLIKAIDKAESKTAGNTGGTLALCFNYGGHQEMADAFNKLSQNSDGSTITVADIENSLYHSEIPPVDIIVRTSGEQRLSGFMMWRAAYAELMFMPKFWPDFTNDDIDEVVAEYGRRQRRYGK